MSRPTGGVEQFLQDLDRPADPQQRLFQFRFAVQEFAQLLLAFEVFLLQVFQPLAELVLHGVSRGVNGVWPSNVL